MTRWGRDVLVLGALLIVSGCAAATTSDGTTRPLAKLATFATADLAQAVAIAEQAGDRVGAACYTALQQYVGQAGQARPAIKGAFSAFALARVGTSKLSAGVPEDLHVACAPVVLDAQQTLIRLGVIGAGTAVGVPGVGALLPK